MTRLSDPPKALPQTGFLRFNQIVPDLIPIGRSTWYAGVKAGIYPQPVKLGRRMSAWRVEEIRALIESLPRVVRAPA